MLGVVFLFIILFLVNQMIFGYFGKRHSFFSKEKMNLLYLYHTVFFGIYYYIALNNPSDSKHYFSIISKHDGSWLELFGTDTNFIYFVGFPFQEIGFSYEMLMFLFSWLGYLGFVYAYMFFRENIPIDVKVFKSVDFLTLILYLPNMHFWTASLGKGSIIFLGIMIITYAFSKPTSRLFLLVLGSVIVFHIRPHVFLFIAVGIVAGFLTGKQKISLGMKLLIYSSLIVTLILVQNTILQMVDLQGSDNLVEGFQDFSEKRTEDLEKATSGVDISSYPLPLKLFTFWFRPLFFDAPSFLGFATSLENVVYLLLFIKILNKKFLSFIRKSPAVVKTSLVIFLLTSFAMTFVTSNLGIILRQKSMVMYYLFFIIYYFLAQEKYNKYLRMKKLKLQRKKEAQRKVQII